ncbi:unnamed protein product [Musa acuminata subsp. burmannicoides]
MAGGRGAGFDPSTAANDAITLEQDEPRVRPRLLRLVFRFRRRERRLRFEFIGKKEKGKEETTLRHPAYSLRQPHSSMQFYVQQNS